MFCVKKRKLKFWKTKKHVAGVEWAVKVFWAIDFLVGIQKWKMMINMHL